LAFTAGGARPTRARAQPSQPWHFGFQCNERYLDWDGSAQAQLLKLHCAEKLGWSRAQVDEGLSELSVLLPDLLPGRLQRMKAALLLSLLRNRAGVAETLLALKEELPRANASAMVSRYPALLTDYAPDAIRAKIKSLRCFGGAEMVEKRGWGVEGLGDRPLRAMLEWPWHAHPQSSRSASSIRAAQRPTRLSHAGPSCQK